MHLTCRVDFKIKGFCPIVIIFLCHKFQVNNGTLVYDHDRDGTLTQLAGCEAKLRNLQHDTYVSIRYENDVLTGNYNYTPTTASTFHYLPSSALVFSKIMKIQV